MKQRLPTLFLLAAALAFAGCGTLFRGTPDTGPATTLSVDNQAYLDMTVYVLRGAERVRLGIASGGVTTNFTIPSDIVQLVQPLRFVADPIGSTRASVIDQITVNPGDQVKMIIPPS